MESPAAAPDRTVRVRAPTRIDLGGGWTDVPPYCDERGGFVCNVAIDRYAVATVRPDETYRGGAAIREAIREAATARGGPADRPPPAEGAVGTQADSPLIVAAVRHSGVRGVHVDVTNDFPVGAGLGGSSAASAAIIGALARWSDLPWDRVAIAEAGRRIEVEDLGIAGGRQDHYAATHGGALALTFTDRVQVRRIELSAATRAAFEARALLIYTGESRISGSTVSAVLDAYRAGDRRVLDALATMKALAVQMADALGAGELDSLGALMAEHWVHQRSLHPAIPTPRIDEIVTRAHGAGATGWKAMGASGGGCVLVLSPVEHADAVRRELAALGDPVTFALDSGGLAVA